MDVRIADGDIALTVSGSYEYITGPEEAVQRVRLSALTVKGDFPYDRELGTDYSGLSADDELLREKLEILLIESCADIADTSVRVISCPRDELVAVIEITYKEKVMTTEVDLSGIIQ